MLQRRWFLIVGIVLVAALLAMAVAWIPACTIGSERSADREMVGRLRWSELATCESLLAEMRAMDDHRRKLIEAELVRGLRTHRNPDVRAACAYCLKRKAPGVITACLSAIESDPDPRVRINAAFALGELGGQAELAALSRAVQRNRSSSGSLADPAVAAVRAIGRIGGRTAAQMLLDLWHDATLPRATSGIVVAAMGDTGDLRCLEVVEAVLRSPESGEQLRSYAAWGLLKLQVPPDSPVRDRVLRPLFLRCIRDSAQDVRLSGIMGLAGSGRREDIPQLQELLRKETQPMSRQAIEAAIQEIQHRVGAEEHSTQDDQSVAPSNPSAFGPLSASPVSRPERPGPQG